MQLVKAHIIKEKGDESSRDASWIPGDPLDVLEAILILGHEGDVYIDKIKQLVETS